MLLVIDSSSQGHKSVTRQLTAQAARFIQRQGETVKHLDVHKNPLPAFSFEESQITMNNHILDEFLSAERVIVGVPIYNFSIPSVLKAYVDRLVIAQKTFKYTDQGPQGLMPPKALYLCFASGGAKSVSKAFSEDYLRQLFGFVGLTDIKSVWVEQVAMGEQETRIQEAFEAMKDWKALQGSGADAGERESHPLRESRQSNSQSV